MKVKKWVAKRASRLASRKKSTETTPMAASNDSNLLDHESGYPSKQAQTRSARIQLAALFFSPTWGQDKEEIQHALVLLQRNPDLAQDWFLGKFPLVNKIYLPPIFHFAKALQVDVATLKAVGVLYPDILEEEENLKRLGTPNKTPLWVACNTRGMPTEVIRFLLHQGYGLAKGLRVLCPIHAYLLCHLSATESEPSIDYELILGTLRELQDSFFVKPKTIELAVRLNAGPVLLQLMNQPNRVSWGDHLIVNNHPLDMKQARSLVSIFPKTQKLQLRMKQWTQAPQLEACQFVMQGLQLYTTQIRELVISLPRGNPETSAALEAYLGSTTTLLNLLLDQPSLECFDTMVRGLKYNNSIESFTLLSFRELTSPRLAALMQSGILNLQIEKCSNVTLDATSTCLDDPSCWKQCRLKLLNVWESHFDDASFRSFALMVQKAPTLRSLFLYVPQRGFQFSDFTEPLVSILLRNELDIALTLREGDSVDMRTMCRQLESNKSKTNIHRLQIRIDPDRPSQDLEMLASCLMEHNTTVQAFGYCCHQKDGISVDKSKALAVMVYAAHMNQFGRKKLRHKNASLVDLVGLLKVVNHENGDLTNHMQESVLYGLLREVPSLWARSASPHSPRSKRRRWFRRQNRSSHIIQNSK